MTRKQRIIALEFQLASYSPRRCFSAARPKRRHQSYILYIVKILRQGITLKTTVVILNPKQSRELTKNAVDYKHVDNIMLIIMF